MGQASSSSSSSSADVAAVPEDAVLDVELTIVSAKDIAAGDYMGLGAALKGHLSSSDAYALIEVDGQKVAWTRPVFDTREPEWNEKFFFKNVRPASVCKLYVLDKDVGADDALGETHFTAANTNGAETTFELPISREGKPAGCITVKVKSETKSARAGAVMQQYGPVHYSVHSSVATGLITQSITDDSKLESLAYHVQLHNLAQFLPTENEWNKNHTPVQRIFSPDHPEAPMLRKAVATEHAMIYKHDKNTLYGTMDSSSDLFKLMHNGERLEKPVLFTYAIIKSGWYFSETGASFFKDMLSKHMLHSGAQFSVLYAGEFHVEKSHFGRTKLVIDNNSGTYAPPKAELPQLKALFENNFPGISVEALDRDDPDLKEKRKEILDAWA